MEYATTVETHHNVEEEDLADMLGETTIKLNVSSVVEWDMWSCNSITDLINLLLVPHNFKNTIHKET